MRAHAATKPRRRRLRDTTFVKVSPHYSLYPCPSLIFSAQYEVLVDKYAHHKKKKAVFEQHTFYGQLQHILVCPLPAHKFFNPPNTQNLRAETLLFAAIRPCRSKPNTGTGIHHYSNLGSLEVIDLASIQAVVGRVFNQDHWAIIDRSGELAHAQFIAGGGELENGGESDQ
jgi:hypothetical protein